LEKTDTHQEQERAREEKLTNPQCRKQDGESQRLEKKH